MTFQEILEGITRHRANPVFGPTGMDNPDIGRKFDEIEWALQAMCEQLVELNGIASQNREAFQDWLARHPQITGATEADDLHELE